MSIDSVARMAGVSKPTIYRRWKGKEDLATAALARLRSKEAPVSRTVTREELAGVLRNFRKSLLRPHGMALVGTVLAEERHTPELLRLFRERLVQPRRQALCSALQRGIDRGEVRSDCDITVAVNLLIGSFYAAYLAGDSISPSWPRRIVGSVWPGVAHPGMSERIRVRRSGP